MKKLLASVIISTLLVFPAPILAAPSTRVNVETITFDKLEQYLNSYNVQIHNNNNTVSDMTVPTAEDKAKIKDQMDKMATQMGVYNAKIDSLPAGDIKDIYVGLVSIIDSNIKSLLAQYNSFDSNLDKASDGKFKASIQYESVNKQIVWGAEQLYISYNTLYYQIKQQSNQLYLLNQQLNAMKVRKDLGLVSMIIYKNLENTVKELEFAVKSMNNQSNTLREQFNLMFNQNYDTALQIGETPELDKNLLAAMNLEVDYKVAEQKSYNLRSKFDVNSYEKEAEERQFKLDFKESYQNVLNKQESLALKEYTLQNQKELFDQAQVKYKTGLISRITLEEQKTAYDNQVLTVEIANDDLFKAYRQYEWMKKGLSI